MTISLKKGERISLAKQSGLNRVAMGLGWDAAKPKGILGMFGGGGGDIDLDASVLVFDANGRVLDTIWFRQLKGMNGAIRHSGDNRTGDGDGDDETIFVDLAALPANAVTLVFTVNSFTGQSFAKVDQSVCRLVDVDSKAELCRFTLSEQGNHTGIIMASLSRKSGEWVMTAIGKVTSGRTVQDLAASAAEFA